MYAGHVALALGARGVRRDIPLWALVLAAQACDWVELVLGLGAGWSRPELWSHAYPYVVVAAVAAAVAVGAWKRSIGAAVVVLLLYLSHPAGDYVTSFKVLWAGGSRVGLLLVEWPQADFVFQATLCVVGWLLYLRSLPAPRRRRPAVVLPLVLLLTLQGLADLALMPQNQPLMRSLRVGRVTALPTTP